MRVLSPLTQLVFGFGIEDTGPGIPAGDLPHLFEPFFTKRPGGTGLGLAISHRIVEAHGGQIHVATEVGHGTRFEVSLPACLRTPLPQVA